MWPYLYIIKPSPYTVNTGIFRFKSNPTNFTKKIYEIVTKLLLLFRGGVVISLRRSQKLMIDGSSADASACAAVRDGGGLDSDLCGEAVVVGKG